MNKKKVKQLRCGLYQAHWKSGGWSLAAVGQFENGEKWITPTNWVTPVECRTCQRRIWKRVKSVILLGTRSSTSSPFALEPKA